MQIKIVGTEEDPPPPATGPFVPETFALSNFYGYYIENW